MMTAAAPPDVTNSFRGISPCGASFSGRANLTRSVRRVPPVLSTRPPATGRVQSQMRRRTLVHQPKCSCHPARDLINFAARLDASGREKKSAHGASLGSLRTMQRTLSLAFAIAGTLLASTATFAQGVTGKITVMTSFSKDVTDPFKKAFEAAHPGTTVEVQNRNTNAGVKLLDETKAANAVDIFWASAPDAFEVLKGKKLLQAYKPKAIRHSGKDRRLSDQRQGWLLLRFRRVRLRHHVERALREGQQAARTEGVAGPRQARLLRSRLDRRAVTLRHHASDDRNNSPRRRLGQGLAHAEGDGWQLPQCDRALVRRARGGELRPSRLWRRHRFLCVLGGSIGLPCQVRLPVRHDDRAGQRRRRRQCAEQGWRGGVRRISPIASRPGSAAGEKHPPPTRPHGYLRQGASRLSEPLQGHFARRQGDLRTR